MKPMSPILYSTTAIYASHHIITKSLSKFQFHFNLLHECSFAFCGLMLLVGQPVMSGGMLAWLCLAQGADMHIA